MSNILLRSLLLGAMVAVMWLMLPRVHIALADDSTMATTTILTEATTSSPMVTETASACDKYRDIINSYDWPVETALQVCEEESGGQAGIVNGHDHHYNKNGKLICIGSTGLFQIGCLWPKTLGYSLRDTKDPAKNIDMAYQIWLISGWRAWGACRKLTCT